MSAFQVLNSFRVLVPVGTGTVVMASIPIFKTGEGDTEEPQCDPNKTLIRPRDLPIYSDCEKITDEKSGGKSTGTQDESNPVKVFVSSARRELWKSYSQVQGLKTRAIDGINIGITHTDDALSKLREEENANYRYGATAGGGLAGLLFSIRKGFIKKLFYTSVGAATVATIVYPDEAKEIFDQVFDLSKHYWNVGSHFIKSAALDILGVEPPQKSGTDLGWIKAQASSISELWSSSASTGSGTQSQILTPINAGSIMNLPSAILHHDQTYSFKPDWSQKTNRDQSNPADKDMYTLRN